MDRTTYLRREVLEEVMDHCRAEYPVEACGILLGASAPEETWITEIIRARNVKRSSVRYEIDSSTLQRAHFTAEMKGLEVVGFYHSHPELRSEPSKQDAESALPGQIYLIISLHMKAGETVAGWRWSSETEEFLKEELIIQP